MVLGDENWIDMGSYWLHKYPQLSDEWHYEKKCRLTTSIFGSIVHPSFYKGPNDVILDFTQEHKVKSPLEMIALNHGLHNEPLARKWYMNKYNVEVEEIGLAIPKWDIRIGASSDGVVIGTNGIIEIKSPINFYNQVRKYIKAINSGWKPPPFYHEHIKDAHYDQMQGAMAILNKDWCDYIVYCPNENQVFVEKVFFNKKYWENELYPTIKKFLDLHPNIFH